MMMGQNYGSSCWGGGGGGSLPIIGTIIVKFNITIFYFKTVP